MHYETMDKIIQIEKILATIRILIVDDEVVLRTLLKDALNRLGFADCTTMEGGNDALSIIKRQPFDLLITDWQMAKGDGVSLVRNVRALTQHPNQRIPVLMLTGRALRDDIQQARDAGITEFLSKPFTMNDLCKRIMMIVDKPRDFVLAPNFKGPDRRRRPEEAPGYERRTTKPRIRTPQEKKH